MGLAVAAGIHAATVSSVRTVNLERSGTLRTVLTINNLDGVTGVALNGAMNNDDVAWLRYLCGRDTLGEPVKAYITEVDLSGVTFDAKSGAPYFLRLGSNGKKYSVDSTATLPQCMFYDTDIERITFPIKLDYIAPFALSSTRLTDISISDGVDVAANAITMDSCLVNLTTPCLSSQYRLGELVLPALKNLTVTGDVDYISSGTFNDMAELETVVFNGLVGHSDGYLFTNCPKLRSVTFNGPILTTGGPLIARNCPELQSVTFNGMVGHLGLTEFENCPKIHSVTVNFKPNEAEYSRLVDFEIAKLQGKGFLKRMAKMVYQDMDSLGRSNGFVADADRLAKAYTAYRDRDINKSKLQILKESAPYSVEHDTAVGPFTYQPATDSALVAARRYFNLDSIAGNGDDVSRIKNLLYWVHDLVPHDGSSSWPQCPLTLRDIHQVCKDENRGVNCRMMAIMLTEALLAEGIPARYLTCQSKLYDEDQDCHVICVAWSRELNKWVWADPTFAAYVTDENGTWLHPGEVRQRLIDGSPLMLNDDANWNHKSPQTKEDYLENYMAKNLYIIESRTHQQAAPEGKGAPRSKYITLVPVGFEYYSGHPVTSDPEAFWAAPY